MADTKPVFAHNAIGNGDKDGILPVENLDRVLYSVNITYTAKSQQFHYANDETDTTGIGAYGGFTLYTEGGNSLYFGKLEGKLPNITMMEIDPMKAIGKDTFMNEEFLLQITTEYVAKDAGLERDDLKLGLWFNGKLYNEEYLYYFNIVPYLGVRVNTNENYAPTVWSYYEEMPTECASYPKWTFKNSKIEDGVRPLGWNWGETYGDTLDQTKFIGRMYFTDTEQYVLLGSNSGDYHGLGFQMKQGNLSVIYYDDGDLTAMPLTMEASAFGLESFLNVELDFELNVRKLVERDDRILVEVIPVINGQMYQNKSALFNVHKASFVQNACTINGVKVTNSDEVVIPPEKEDVIDFHDSYEKMTLRDYLLESITFSYGMLYKVYDDETLDGTSFGATVKFSKDNNGTTAFYLGGDMWYGIRVEAQTTGMLGISHIATDGTQTWIASVDPKKTGLETFLGKSFEMKMTFDFYGEKAGKVNCKIGLYINGQLYDGKHLTVKNVEKETMTRTLFIYGAGQGSVTITSIYKEVDFRIWGLTKDNWKQVLGIA